MQKITRKGALENYIERTTAEDDFGNPLKPKNQNDVGMAELFVNEYKGEMRYNSSTGWLVWNGKKWEISDLKAEQKYVEFIKRVLELAKKDVHTAYDTLGDMAIEEGEKKAKTDGEKAVKEALAYFKFINKMCDGGKINAPGKQGSSPRR